MRALCYDPATSSGWAVGEKSGLIASGRLIMPKRPPAERLAWLHQEATKLASTYEPDLIVSETPFFPVGERKFNPKVIAWAHQIKGVLWAVAGLAGIPVEEYSPEDWRGYLLGYARRPKGSDEKHMKKATMNRLRALGYQFGNDDEAEAIGLMLHVLHGAPANARAQGDLLSMPGADL